MSALTEQILADINARVEAAILGTRTAGAHCAASPGSVLRVRDIEQAAKKLAAIPKPVVGIVCRTDAVARVRRMADAEALLGAVPVYEKQDQPELYRAFYDREEMHRYLSPNASGQPHPTERDKTL